MSATECSLGTSIAILSRIAETLRPEASQEVDKLFEKLSYAAPERIYSVLMKGAGTYRGIIYLCKRYGTDKTAEVYPGVLKIMEQRVAEGLPPLVDAI